MFGAVEVIGLGTPPTRTTEPTSTAAKGNARASCVRSRIEFQKVVTNMTLRLPVRDVAAALATISDHLTRAYAKSRTK